MAFRATVGRERMKKLILASTVAIQTLIMGCTSSDPVIQACEEFDSVVGLTEEEVASSNATPDQEKGTKEWQDIQAIKLEALMGAKADKLFALSEAAAQPSRATSSFADLSFSAGASWEELRRLSAEEDRSDWELIQKAVLEEVMVLEECKDYGASIENGT